WSKIASHLPGRTDNEIKNHWNTHIKKKLKKMGIDPVTHKPITSPDPTDDQTKEQNQPNEQFAPASSSMSPNKSLVSAITEETKEDRVDRTTLSTSNKICTDDIPLIDPSEILVQPRSSSSASSTSSSSSSDSILQDLDFPSMDWSCDNNVNLISLLEDDFKWEDLLIDDDGNSNMITIDPIDDQASQDWAYGLLL
ncbi:hypothetical protein CRG98_011179, partial [Punica granatum]